MKKEIVVGGFSKEQRQKELEKIKKKYEKKGYKYLDFIDNGTLKSVAIFEINEVQLKKEKSQNLILLGIFFLGLAAILFFKAN